MFNHKIKTVGNAECVQEGFETQLRSVVMLKNSSESLTVQMGLNVYLPERYMHSGRNWFGFETPEHFKYLLNPEIADLYFNVVESPEEADFAIVSIIIPGGGNGYDRSDVQSGSKGYVAVSLQYEEYTAENTREIRFAGEGHFEDVTNRYDNWKSTKATNSFDLQMIRYTREKRVDKTMIVTIHVSNPMVFNDFEELASSVYIHSGIHVQALRISFQMNLSLRDFLPSQIPSCLRTIEEQLEDTPHDLEPHRDAYGNLYDFGFGLNWNGIISDQRVEKYVCRK